jgi:hypothetical protein
MCLNPLTPQPQKATRATITQDTARAIFNSSLTPNEIAEVFNVTPRMVYAIKSGRSWAYATGTEAKVDRRVHYDDPRSGTIALYSSKGAKVVERRYKSGESRRKILSDFKRSFGETHFRKLTVAITPDINWDTLALIDLENPRPGLFGLNRRGKEVKITQEDAQHIKTA